MAASPSSNSRYIEGRCNFVLMSLMCFIVEDLLAVTVSHPRLWIKEMLRSREAYKLLPVEERGAFKRSSDKVGRRLREEKGHKSKLLPFDSIASRIFCTKIISSGSQCDVGERI